MLLADYGYFNFHSGLKGTSISGYISGGSVRTGEIDAERIIKILIKENVKYILTHEAGRLYYPYGSELYYFEPHHIKSVKNYDMLRLYIEENYNLKMKFSSRLGPVFSLYERKQ
ncbi:MAG: hypothetical protein N2746_02225 [Deltaproteobacteria bacterium]|nr:hypothetical protein [Deltaproteobacteria bacterium]